MSRRWLVVLGDQLDEQSRLLREYNPQTDTLWMGESDGENRHVPHHQHQIVMFLSAMRHFAAQQRALGRSLVYRVLDPHDQGWTLGRLLARDLAQACPAPEVVRLVLPGDRRVLEQIREACGAIPLEVLPDDHFYCTPEEFAKHAQGRRTLRLEYFYREMRRRHRILLDDQGQPLGGQWNYDAENRQAFGPAGPPLQRAPLRFEPDALTREVIALVSQRYPDHLRSDAAFALPIVRSQALELLEDFLEHRLAYFGAYQDAMWDGEAFLYHSRLSTALNLKLLSPREVCGRAEEAYHQGKVPLNAVEGFVRQILGWREYIRGVYWTSGDDYLDENFLQHDEPLPEFFWTGETSMKCLSDVLHGVRQHAYSHHIQRLMVTGLFCLLLGVRPRAFHDWHMATHCDAIDWVSAPNVIGMSQFADGGLLASKPYCASGAYIDKMSNYCQGCVYRPKVALGPKACPFTTLYWDFLGRHRERLAKNQRLSLQLRNWDRKPVEEQEALRQEAQRIRDGFRSATDTSRSEP